VSAFLHSLRSDLLDRRFLPLLALLGVALVAALAYAVLGGGSSTSSTPPVPNASSGATGATGAVAISPAPAANEAVAETTNDSSHQHAGHARNPFAPLPGANKAAAKKAGAASAKPTGSSSGARPSPSSAGGTTPSVAPKVTTPAKPKVYIHYHVTVQFGAVPPSVEGAPPQPAQLKTYDDIALDTPFPGKTDPQLVYLGVVLRTGKEAAFALTGEAILHGSAVCKPSPAQCQAIELQAGQAETLEVVEANGSSVTYELKLIGIDKSLSSTASAARAHVASSAQSKAGRELLRRAGLSALPGLHYATEKGIVRSGK
jgi:hypothetical protein